LSEEDGEGADAPDDPGKNVGLGFSADDRADIRLKERERERDGGGAKYGLEHRVEAAPRQRGLGLQRA
jgi:hypothetical protein